MHLNFSCLLGSLHLKHISNAMASPVWGRSPIHWKPHPNMTIVFDSHEDSLVLCLFTGQEFCDVCPAGYYCTEGIQDYSPNECPTGHYCPNGTQSALQYPCSIGTYNPNSTQSSEDACISCPPGKFCGYAGLASDTGDCEAGWFCTGGSAEAQPYVRGKLVIFISPL